MRVVLCNAVYPTPEHPHILGGAEVFVRKLAEALVDAGDDVTVLRFSPTGEAGLEVVGGVKVHMIPVRNFSPPFKERSNPVTRLAWHLVDDWVHVDPSFERVLAYARPDIFHSNTLNGLGAGVWQAAKRRGVPILHTLHDYYLICPRCSLFKDGHICETTCGSCSLLTVGRRKRTTLVDAVVGVSRRTLDIHLGRGLFPDTARQHVIQHAANAAIAVSPQPAPTGKLKIGFLGRFAEEKGARLLTEAVGRLPPDAVELYFAGRSSADEQALLRSLAPNVSMTFVGFVTPGDFYPTVDIASMPSIWEEPSGLALLDALAAGRPVVTTGCGGISENFEDGVTGWIAKPDTESWTKVLKQLIENPHMIDDVHKKLASRSEKRSFTDVVTDYRRIYKSMCGK